MASLAEQLGSGHMGGRAGAALLPEALSPLAHTLAVSPTVRSPGCQQAASWEGQELHPITTALAGHCQDLRRGRRWEAGLGGV